LRVSCGIRPVSIAEKANYLCQDAKWRANIPEPHLHLTLDQPLRQRGPSNMQVLRGFEKFLQFVSDGYCLLVLAIKNQFKKPAAASVEKERAKAVNAE
jgi:hypothetical protein